jgi:hypothetical protein
MLVQFCDAFYGCVMQTIVLAMNILTALSHISMNLMREI